MKISILKWCDRIISILKKRNIFFKNGVAVIPQASIYEKMPVMISTFKYRNDIPVELRSKSLLSYFMPDKDLWPRLEKIDKELVVLKEYAGITGFDLSPSLGMLIPRQRLSIFINSLFNCYCAINGIKIMPNARIGEFGTIPMINSIPLGSCFITSRLGCQNHGNKAYGVFLIDKIIRIIRPSTLFVYGFITLAEATHFIKKYSLKIVTFPDRRSRVRNSKKVWYYFEKNGVVFKSIYNSSSEERGEL